MYRREMKENGKEISRIYLQGRNEARGKGGSGEEGCGTEILVKGGMVEGGGNRMVREE